MFRCTYCQYGPCESQEVRSCKKLQEPVWKEVPDNEGLGELYQELFDHINCPEDSNYMEVRADNSVWVGKAMLDNSVWAGKSMLDKFYSSFSSFSVPSCHYKFYNLNLLPGVKCKYEEGGVNWLFKEYYTYADYIKESALVYDLEDHDIYKVVYVGRTYITLDSIKKLGCWKRVENDSDLREVLLKEYSTEAAPKELYGRVKKEPNQIIHLTKEVIESRPGKCYYFVSGTFAKMTPKGVFESMEGLDGEPLGQYYYIDDDLKEVPIN